MLKKILLMMMAVVLMGGIVITPFKMVAAAVDKDNIITTNSEANIPSENITVIELDVVKRTLPEVTTSTAAKSEMDKCTIRKTAAHNMAESARALGFAETSPVIVLAKKEWAAAQKDYTHYNNIYQDLYTKELEAAEAQKWGTKAEEYPTATQIWRYFKDLGYNDYVCAGIMGNLMAEVGGQTLNIQHTLSGNGYYGMCQWNRAYGQIWGADLTGQCDFLRDTIKYEIDTYGKCYQRGFNYDSFLALTDEKAAALAFAKSYERCGSGSYSVRQTNATKALEYFTN